MIAASWGREAEWVAVPVGRLPAAFFDLKSGVAGELLQTLANHRLHLAIVGDVKPHVATSQAFHDFVWESNRGRHVWFVADEAELKARLTR